jgi:nucleotide-binding universal stress UspA family protein
MALRDLLVHVPGTPDSGGTIDAALALAGEHNAHLIGLGIRAPLGIPSYTEAQLPDTTLTIIREREDRRLAEARQLFESKAGSAGRADRTEWRSDMGVPHRVFGLHARYVDLSILSQDNPGSQDVRFADLAEDVLISSGRPILVLPAQGPGTWVGRTSLVAWNGSREAARALADAMPLLEKAQAVEIFTAGDQDIGDLPGADIAAHLARHRIDVDVFRFAGTESSAGDALLSRAADIGADFIVMGGYGRSRFREYVLGGVTRHVLQHLTVPVLMSH